MREQRPCVGGRGKTCLVWTVLSVQGFLVWTVSCAPCAKQAVGHKLPSRNEAQKAEAVPASDFKTFNTPDGIKNATWTERSISGASHFSPCVRTWRDWNVPVARPLSRLKLERALDEQERKATGADGTKSGRRRIPGFKFSPGNGKSHKTTM